MRKLTKRQYGPIQGKNLERHIDQKLVIGEIINFGPTGDHEIPLAFYDHARNEVLDCKGRVLLLGVEMQGTGANVVAYWKIHHLDLQRQFLVNENLTRRYLKLKVQENWFKRYVKGKTHLIKEYQ